MTSQPDLIYTSGDNALLAKITLEAGWLVGMRSDKSACVPISFMDIDYRLPDFDRHLSMVKEHRPKIAVVPDLSDTYVCPDDIRRALHQTERLTPYCETVLIIPKLSKQIDLIPASFRIGYSLPSSNGGAKYGVWKLEGRNIHLLGGSPQLQRKLYQHCAVLSVDGNMSQKMAFRFSKYWVNRTPYWVDHPLKHFGEANLPYKCIQLSLKNIKDAWLNVLSSLPPDSLWSA